LERGIKVELDEIEERLEVRVTAVSRLLLSAFCQLREKRDDLIGNDSRQLPIRSNVVTESAEGVRRTQSYFFPEFILWYSRYVSMAWLSSITFSFLAGY
jgi:hypothetical protein